MVRWYVIGCEMSRARRRCSANASFPITRHGAGCSDPLSDSVCAQPEFRRLEYQLGDRSRPQVSLWGSSGPSPSDGQVSASGYVKASHEIIDAKAFRLAT